LAAEGQELAGQEVKITRLKLLIAKLQRV